MDASVDISPRAHRWGLAGVLAAAVGLALLLSAANVWFGNLNQDEGWYLNAAREVAAGRLPYDDFFFTQGPVMPSWYAALAPAWTPWGVLGGRALTAVLGLLAGAFAAALAALDVPRGRRIAVAATTLLLVSGNVYHSYFTAIPKTYALCSLFLMAGLFAVRLGMNGGHRPWSLLGGLLIALAAGTRLSFGLSLAGLGVWLLLHTRRLRGSWVWFGIGGAYGLVIVHLPYVLGTGEAWRFAQSFHTAREGGGVLFLAGSLSRLVRGYLPLAAVGAMAALLHLHRRPAAPGDATGERAILPAFGPSGWLAAVIPVLVLHLLSPFPYDDYQVPLMPPVAAAVSLFFWRALDGVGAAPGRTIAPLGRARTLGVLAVLLAWAGACAFASPINQEWFVIRQDRFWPVMKSAPDVVRLRAVGKWLAENTHAHERLLTTDPYLAVEARRRVPVGLEMGPFGYFPDLDSDRAARMNVLNHAGLLELLRETQAPVAAISGYGFALAAPQMRPLTEDERREIFAALGARYRHVATVPDFGQGHTPLELWVRKDRPVPPPPPGGRADE